LGVNNIVTNVISRSKTLIILLALILLSAIGIISALVIGNATVNEVQDCATEFYDAIEDVFGYVARERDIYDNCVYYQNDTKCSDEPFNTSCGVATTEIGFKCSVGKESYQSYEKVSEQTVQKSRNVCVNKGYTVSISGSTKKIDFDKAGYYCSLEGNIITCDSVYDGNGDGKCKSGETCIKFEIANDGIGKIHKRIDSVSLKDIEVEDA